jgi:hypothetical protein
MQYDPNSTPRAGKPLRDQMLYAHRKPVRLTITVPFAVHEELVFRSNLQGRSVSNLSAWLLEQGLFNTD